MKPYYFNLSLFLLALLLNANTGCEAKKQDVSEECAGGVKYASESAWISEFVSAKHLEKPVLDSTFVLKSIAAYSTFEGQFYYNFYYEQTGSTAKVSYLYDCKESFIDSDTSYAPSQNIRELLAIQYAGMVLI